MNPAAVTRQPVIYHDENVVNHHGLNGHNVYGNLYLFGKTYKTDFDFYLRATRKISMEDRMNHTPNARRKALEDYREKIKADRAALRAPDASGGAGDSSGSSGFGPDPISATPAGEASDQMKLLSYGVQRLLAVEKEMENRGTPITQNRLVQTGEHGRAVPLTPPRRAAVVPKDVIPEEESEEDDPFSPPGDFPKVSPFGTYEAPEKKKKPDDGPKPPAAAPTKAEGAIIASAGPRPPPVAPPTGAKAASSLPPARRIPPMPPALAAVGPKKAAPPLDYGPGREKAGAIPKSGPPVLGKPEPPPKPQDKPAAEPKKKPGPKLQSVPKADTTGTSSGIVQLPPMRGPYKPVFGESIPTHTDDMNQTYVMTGAIETRIHHHIDGTKPFVWC